MEKQPAYVGKNCYLYRVVDPAPFAYFCPRSIAVLDGSALSVLAATSEDPRKCVVLEGEAPPAPLTPADEAAGKPIPFEWDGPNCMRFHVEDAPAAGWIVVQESWAPGWSATIDGKPTAVRRANGLFMAVAAPSGASEIVLTYHSRAFSMGLIVSGVAVIFCVFLFLWDRRIVMAPSIGASGRDLVWLLLFDAAATAASAMIFPEVWREAIYQASVLL